MRLIDADELIEHAWRDKLDSRELIAQMISTAPTIKEIPTKIPIHIFERLLELAESEDYDRQQYEKGFNEAADALTAEFIEVLTNIQKELNDIDMMKSIVPNIATVQQIENVIYRIDMYLNMLKEKKSGDL